MPRYFFNFKDGSTFLDEDGIELAGLQRLGPKLWSPPAR
jgi:hypothetical protein